MGERPVSAWPVDQAAGEPPVADLAVELARAKERLTFYESFDAVIRDNVARSGELLRQAVSEREQNDQKLREIQADLDRRLAEQRAALEAVSQGLAGLQASLGTLADQVATALAGLADSAMPPLVAGAAPGDPSAAVSAAASEVPSEATINDEAMADLAAATANDVPAPNTVEAPIAATPVESGPSGSPETLPRPEDLLLGPVERIAEASAGPEAAGQGSDASPARRPIDLIVHGVPRAATALALQRHLQELDGVDAVEVREYVSGVLRFQVVATGLSPADLQGWNGGVGLEEVTVRDNVVEVKLATADGF